jgi:phospholipid transport system transporter-binding protein
MAEAALKESLHSVIKVSGQLVPETVPLLLKQSRPLFVEAKGGTLKFDFTEVNVAQTVALSLMMEWLRLGKSSQVAVKFLHIPDSLMSIARLCGVAMVVDTP